MNIQKQNTTNEHGWIMSKDYLTHDQSRVITGELLPCMFGSCIRRIVIWAVTACCLFPNVPILASKIDFKSAFQQMHLNVATALQTCTQLSKFSIFLMWLRLSFGGKPCPYMWGVFSETICDLVNAIMHSNHWGPFELLASNQTLVPQRTLLDCNIPFGEGA
jgi:hypothetical protein